MAAHPTRRRGDHRHHLWRLCVRMVDPADTGPAVRGDRELATAALTILAIIR